MRTDEEIKELLKQNDIAKALDQFTHATQDFEACARIFIPVAYEMLKDRYKDADEKSDALIARLDEAPDENNAHILRELDHELGRLRRISKSDIPDRLKVSLFIGIFASFDLYLGNLLKAIYNKDPRRISGLGTSVSPEDILGASSLDELKALTLDGMIDDLRRESYVKQFEALSKIFAIKLTEFKNWSVFIEAAQRRNLFTHCGGRVSPQYIAKCQEAGYKLPQDIKPGSQLDITPDYFQDTCRVVYEVGTKLGHTLWRKCFPDELDLADKHLSDEIYDHLKNQNWKNAIMLGEFGYGQKKHASKPIQKMITVNYCIALKDGERQEEARKILSMHDWSDATIEFRLAHAVLLGNYRLSSDIMSKIGKKGEILSEDSYHIWPLFSDFRNSPEFLDKYKEIYGHEFIAETKRGAKSLNSKDETETTNPEQKSG